MDDPYLVLMVLALGGAVLVWVFRRLRLSPLLAYIALGILLAPFKNLLFHDDTVVETVAQAGIVLLMFIVGLEFRLENVRRMLKPCLVGGGLQVVLTSTAVALLLLLVGVDPVAAAALGLMVAQTSTAVMMRIYEDRGEADGHQARLGVAVSLFQDISTVALVALLPLLGFLGAGASVRSDFRELGFQAGAMLVLLPALFFGARWLLPKLFERAALVRLPEVLTLMTLGACFAVALVTRWAGSSLALGAFLGGLVLSESPMAAQLRAEISTIRTLGVGFFFVTVGILVDLDLAVERPLLLLGTLVALITVKAAIATAALLAIQTPRRLALGVGVALAQVGEFSFVIGVQAVGLGFLDKGTYSFFLTVAVLSMAVSPFLVTASTRLLRLRRKPSAPPVETEPTVTEAETAIVVGYGPVGRAVTKIFLEFGVKPVVVDLNLGTIRGLQKEGMSAVYGDARRREVLEAAGIDRASSVVVTLPDLEGRLGVVAEARRANPDAQVIVRARYLQEQPRLEEAGASAVRCEESEVAAALAELLLLRRGAPQLRIREATRRIKRELRGEPAPTVDEPPPKAGPDDADAPPRP